MKKIMFNDKYGLTQAVLDGRKTMTRRIVPKHILDAAKKYQEEYYAGALERISLRDAILNMIVNERMFGKDVYKVGEIVAIAQNYEEARPYMSERQREDLTYADMKYLFYHRKKMPGFKNKMFVKAEWMPLHIRITGFNVEYLQDINDVDCLREGIRADLPGVQYSFQSNIGYCGQYPFSTPREAFAALIDKVGKRGTWESNPLVFVYACERID